LKNFTGLITCFKNKDLGFSASLYKNIFSTRRAVMQPESPLDRSADQSYSRVMLSAVDGQVSTRYGEVVADVRVEWFERCPAMNALFTAEALRSQKPIYVPGIDGAQMTIERLDRIVSFYQYGTLTATQSLSLREAAAFAMLAQKYNGTWVSRNHHESLADQALQLVIRIVSALNESEMMQCLNPPAEERFTADELAVVDLTLGWAKLQPNRSGSAEDAD
jgi:hypothetical protein